MTLALSYGALDKELVLLDKIDSFMAKMRRHSLRIYILS